MRSVCSTEYLLRVSLDVCGMSTRDCCALVASFGLTLLDIAGISPAQLACYHDAFHVFRVRFCPPLYAVPVRLCSPADTGFRKRLRAENRLCRCSSVRMYGLASLWYSAQVVLQ